MLGRLGVNSEINASLALLGAYLCLPIKSHEEIFGGMLVAGKSVACSLGAGIFFCPGFC
jgi:hypothetical protein